MHSSKYGDMNTIAIKFVAKSGKTKSRSPKRNIFVTKLAYLNPFSFQFLLKITQRTSDLLIIIIRFIFMLKIEWMIKITVSCQAV